MFEYQSTRLDINRYNAIIVRRSRKQVPAKLALPLYSHSGATITFTQEDLNNRPFQIQHFFIQINGFEFHFIAMCLISRIHFKSNDLVHMILETHWRHSKRNQCLPESSLKEGI
jgi:hypothetical protein